MGVPMSGNGEPTRVIAELAHGGHALRDLDDDAKKIIAEQRTVTALSRVVQEDPVRAAEVATTPFDYLFSKLADEFPHHHLPKDNPEVVVAALTSLGEAMVEQDPAGAGGNSPIPPIYTYWGQFVDHDLTANTDRDTDLSITARPLQPLNPDDVTEKLRNLRNPSLNLDSVYGDGPYALVDPAADEFVPYDGIKFQLGRVAVGPNIVGMRIPPIDDMARDLPRDAARKALIGDHRNDENLVVAQLHVAFLRFHNAAVDWVRANEPERESDAEVFLRARDLTRWTYQWLVVHDFLRTISADLVVDQVLTADQDRLDLPGRGLYMPLEFSVAAFRFGHSMVRAGYDWNRNFGRPGHVIPFASFDLLFQFTGKADPPFGDKKLKALPFNWIAEWDRMVDKESTFPNRFARRIDTLLAPQLNDMANELKGLPEGTPDQMKNLLKMLAVRNLLRGYLLAMPTGEAVAGALGVEPLTAEELAAGDGDVGQALSNDVFRGRTPLWFYVLKEAEVRNGGNTLGEVGSRIVAETIIAQIRQDPGSYLNQTSWSPAHGVRMRDGRPVRSIPDFLRFAGVLA
jgi:heme peroxidase